MVRAGLAGLLAFATTLGAFGPGRALADNAFSSTSAAVSDILFDYDADEWAAFSIRSDGFLDITFARNTPDELYREILGKLKSDPRIKGVLAGKGGPTGSQF